MLEFLVVFHDGNGVWKGGDSWGMKVVLSEYWVINE